MNPNGQKNDPRSEFLKGTLGMLILKVGSKPVKSVDDFKNAMKGESLEKGILLLVRAGTNNRFVVLQRS